ncbi:hypothetical protein [Cereibacter sphaeroides]|uniref:hypothetical protein n=1 Tax=Cereibacter sphaeroides TaxID=1063 RepID=UPI0011C40719|nr:hypothetical protein [Cereibacter sphaeroides]
MPENSKPDDKLENVFYELKGETVEIRRRLAQIDGKENKIVWFVGIMAAFLAIIIPALTVYYNVYNSNQFKEAIERSERRIEGLSGRFQPDSAWAHGLGGENDRTVTLSAVILPVREQEVRFFLVRLSGQVLVRVRGGNGHIIGYQSSSDGPIADFSSRRIDGTIMAHRRALEASGYYDNEGFAEGRLVSENAPLSVTVQRSSAFSSCVEAERAVSELIDLDEAGSIRLTPLFTNISNPVTEPISFQIVVVRGDHPDCEDMASMEVWRFEESIDQPSASTNDAVPSMPLGTTSQDEAE